MATKSSSFPLFGLWQPQSHLKHFYYGSGCVEKYLRTTLPTPSSKVFIITGHSIATKTPLVQQLEALLGENHAGTFGNIKQHGQAVEVDQATEIVASDPSIDTILSLGGGSPIDSAKTISFRMHEKTGTFLTHLSIPTTLSAAECTSAGGYTKADGRKTGFGAAGMGITAIFYDGSYSRYTPRDLWLMTGMRAVDHAVESYYHPYATEMPWKVMSNWALTTLFECLPKAKESHPNDEDTTVTLHLAAFASSGFRGKNVQGGMGLSHSLGHALGSPYGIPRKLFLSSRFHGIAKMNDNADKNTDGETSCLTLGPVVIFKAQNSPEDAKQIARLLTACGGGPPSGEDLNDALEVGKRITEIGNILCLRRSLTERGIDRDQIPIIVERATGGLKEGLVYDGVTRLVEGFY